MPTKTKNNYVFISAEVDYADEFYCEFFAVLPKIYWEQIKLITKKRLENSDEEIEVYFGTNEALSFNGYKNWLEPLKIKEISDKEGARLQELFDTKEEETTDFISFSWGTGSNWLDFALEQDISILQNFDQITPRIEF